MFQQFSIWEQNELVAAVAVVEQEVLIGVQFPHLGIRNKCIFVAYEAGYER